MVYLLWLGLIEGLSSLLILRIQAACLSAVVTIELELATINENFVYSKSQHSSCDVNSASLLILYRLHRAE